jgi:cytochrome c peroxidase
MKHRSKDPKSRASNNKLIHLALASAIVLFCVLCAKVLAHDAHGRSHAPLEARRLKNPLPDADRRWEPAAPVYQRECSGCHGADGKSNTKAAATMAVRPANLASYMMDSMKDGEIFWTLSNGVAPGMPSFGSKLSDVQRWQLTLYVRELRDRARQQEKQKLGSYEWNLPPGFPFPNVPNDNPMTAEKVKLGRYLFYDKRLSLNQTQSCSTCHRQELAFSDGKAHGVGSTGEIHPRSPMSLTNVAYTPVLTWANPNMRRLENQALVPMFGEHPSELGLVGKEEVLVQRMRETPQYQALFRSAFPGETDPFTIANITKALVSFERTLLSGDSPYDRYQRGDDPNAISESAKRGEALFFSEKTECFHCHGGFNFSGSLDYFEKGFAEVEFHNTGLYNVKGPTSYPDPNTGLYQFTNDEADVGRFRAPTLRNIAVTAPYMHDGSIQTLEEVIDHYAAGGRTIKSGPLAGVGADNPNKSEFIKRIDLTRQEKKDMVEFMRSLTDDDFLHNPELSNPWAPTALFTKRTYQSRYTVNGEVAAVYADDGTVALYHRAIKGLMGASVKPNTMEFLVTDKAQLANLKPGQHIVASVTRRNADYLLENIRPIYR